MKPTARLVRAVRQPGKALHLGLALMRGHLYKAWYRLIGKRVTIDCECGAGGNFRRHGCFQHEGVGAAELFFQQVRSGSGFVGFERVGTDDLGELVCAMSGRLRDGTHFVKHDARAESRRLPRSLSAC